MRPIEYTTSEDLDTSDVFVVDGNQGTRKLSAYEALFEMLEAVGGGYYKQQYTRGRHLGTSVTPEQIAAIRNGSFKGLWLGDYWVINDIVWRIVDFNYWLRYHGTTHNYGTPHAVIMPDRELYNALMNSQNTTGDGYMNTEMYKNHLNLARNIIAAAFGPYVIPHVAMFSSGTNPATGEISVISDVSTSLEIPSESQLFGSKNLEILPADPWLRDKTNLKQLALFRHWGWVGESNSMWVRNIASRYAFGAVFNNGWLQAQDANVATGVRPIFSIG